MICPVLTHALPCTQSYIALFLVMYCTKGCFTLFNSLHNPNWLYFASGWHKVIECLVAHVFQVHAGIINSQCWEQKLNLFCDKISITSLHWIFNKEIKKMNMNWKTLGFSFTFTIISIPLGFQLYLFYILIIHALSIYIKDHKLKWPVK